MGAKVIAGNHKAHAISVTMIESSEKKTPGVTAVLSIDEDGPMKGSTIEWTGWLTEATKVRTAESLSLLGCTDEDLLRISQADGPVPIKAPQGVIIVCEDEEYEKNGETRTAVRVRWINDPNRGGAGFAQMGAEKKAAFGDELRGLLLKQNEAKKADKKEEPAAGAPAKQPKW
jgi:hypothetical protein